jgi:hypothetical protein
MQLEGSEFDWTDIFYEQLLPQFTDIGPGYDPKTSDFFGPFAQRFIDIVKGYFEDLDSDDIDRIIRQGQVSEFISVLRRFENGDATLDDLKAVDVSDLTEMPGWSDYYSDITTDVNNDLDRNTSDEDIKQILRDNGYSEEAIGIIFEGEVNNDKFKGNNVLSNALCDIGYSNCSDWSVTAKYPDGTPCTADDGQGTYKNGECVADTSEGTPCWTYSSETGRVEGRRGPNGECIPFSSGGDDDDSSSGVDCTVIDQGNASECGYEITSDGQLVPIDLDKDPDSYPEYEDCGNGIFALTGECPEIDPSLRELIEEYGREAVEDAQRKLKELEIIFGKVLDDPFGTLVEIINKTKTGSALCRSATGAGWVRECVTVGVGIGLPFPLPGPLGSIFKGATVGDIEKAIKEAGHDIGKVLSGETSIEEVMGDLGDWVADKVGGIFKDAGEVSIDDVLGTIGSILVGGGYILTQGLYDKYFKDPINNTIGVPVIPFTSSQECQDSERRTADAEGNCGECIDPNKIYDAAQGKCVDQPEVGSYDCGKEESRQGGTVIDSSECGECLDGFEEDAAGKCIAKDTEIGDNGPTAEECLEENKQHIAGDDVTDSSCGACLEGYEPDDEGVCVKKDTITQVQCPDGTMADTLEECDTTPPNPCDDPVYASQNPTECGTTGTKITCPDGTLADTLEECGTPPNPCDDPVYASQNPDECGTPPNQCDDPVYAAQNPTECGTKNPCDDPVYAAQNPTECGTSTKVYQSAYCKTRGPEGGTLVTIYTDGSQEESFSEVCYKAAPEPPPPSGCQGGKVMNPNTDECECPEGTVENAQGVCVSTGTPPPPPPPDPCAGQGSGKVMSSDGSDECVCPEGTVEDANGNCVTPTTPPPPPEEEEESSGGGGGGGGSGGGGLFAPLPDYQRQPFVAVQYRAPVRAINVLDGFVKKELKNSLFS